MKLRGLVTESGANYSLRYQKHKLYSRQIGREYPGCYNRTMAKEDTSKKRKAKGDRAAKAGKDEEEETYSEEIELEPVKSTKGEPDDNLKRRAEWFQKRTGGA